MLPEAESQACNHTAHTFTQSLAPFHLKGKKEEGFMPVLKTDL